MGHCSGHIFPKETQTQTPRRRSVRTTTNSKCRSRRRSPWLQRRISDAADCTCFVMNIHIFVARTVFLKCTEHWGYYLIFARVQAMWLCAQKSLCAMFCVSNLFQNQFLSFMLLKAMSPRPL